MAGQISSMREKANRFFLTLCISVGGATGFALTNELILKYKYFYIFCFIFMLFVSCCWFKIIRSYRQLNSVKFQIIGWIEEKLPCNMYKVEWEDLTKGISSKNIYKPLTYIEEAIPIIFIITYCIFIIFLYNHTDPTP